MRPIRHCFDGPPERAGAPAPEPSPSPPSWHVILVGIDAYEGGAPPLGGCVNDIDAVQRFLIKRLGVPSNRIRRYAAPLNDGVERPTEVETGVPTRENLLGALEAIAAAAGEQDRVFVYYSGHGTQRFVKASDGKRYYREALVPYDNFVLDRERLVFDFELNALLAKIAGRTRHVTVVLDCCCSAGATRARQGPSSRTRFAPPIAGREFEPISRTFDIGAAPKGFVAGSFAGCMVVAACLDDESARESDRPAAGEDGEARKHGELTRAFLARLASVVPDEHLPSLTWAHIWRSVIDDVKAVNPHQTPWLSSHPGRLVFCGPPTEGDLGYAVRRDADVFRLDEGSLSGVTEDALIAVYPPLPDPMRFLPVGQPEDLAARIGLLRVVAAERSTSTAEAVPGNALPETLPSGARGRLVRAAPQARLRVSLSPYDAGLAKRITEGSGLLTVVGEGESGEVELLRRDNGDRELTDDVFGPDPERGDHTLCVIPTASLEALPEPGAPDLVVALLEHYYAYSAPRRMAERCKDLERALRLRLLDCNHLQEPIPRDRADDALLEELQPERAPSYQLSAGRLDGLGPRGSVFCMELENVSKSDLFVTLFYCNHSGSVALFGSRLMVTARSRTRAWVNGDKGSPVVAALPASVPRGIDRIVAIGTTDRDAALDHMRVDSTFAGVTRGASSRGTRGAGRAPELWTSASAVLRLAGRILGSDRVEGLVSRGEQGVEGASGGRS